MGYRILQSARRLAKSGRQHGAKGSLLQGVSAFRSCANFKAWAFPATLACQSVTCDITILSITLENDSSCLLCCMELDLQVAMINFHDCTAA